MTSPQEVIRLLREGRCIECGSLATSILCVGCAVEEGRARMAAEDARRKREAKP